MRRITSSRQCRGAGFWCSTLCSRAGGSKWPCEWGRRRRSIQSVSRRFPGTKLARFRMAGEAMQIRSCEAQLLQIPLERAVVSGMSSGDRGAGLTSIFMPMVTVTTESGLVGRGYTWTLAAGGTAMRQVLQDDIGPVVVGLDACDHEQILHRLYWKTQGVGRHGLVTQAIAAVDLALWDLKGQVAELPLYRLLGGLRDRAPAYGSDGGWLNMSVDEMVEAGHEYLGMGLRGVKLKVGHDDPVIDVERVSQVRDALGAEAWIAVDANQKWDLPRATRAGRAFEQLGCAWFEEPMLCDDVIGHARLSRRLDIPVALGETLGSRFEIHSFLEAGAVEVVQPDLARVGGITEFLRVATLCEVYRCPVEPHLMMEASVHLACGVPGVEGLEYMPWLTPAFAEPLRLEDGNLLAPQGPGLGLEISESLIERFRVA
ncbi:MAG TPA: enolase [Planctomycetaceae bacterium]|nr:enolase [Planctomycetaceae bacterium]